MMKWCCTAFRERFELAGERGFGVFVSTRDDPRPAFILQHRTLDRGTAIPNTAVPMSVFADCQIHFCPWCGVKLEKYYRGEFKLLDRSELKV